MHCLALRTIANRILSARAAACCIALALAGHSMQAAADSGSSAAAKPRTHTVIIEGMVFTPPLLEVHSGDTVIWVNKDAFPHNVTAAERSFHSNEIKPNRSWTFKARKRGSFDYVCTLHPGMKASLIVK